MVERDYQITDIRRETDCGDPVWELTVVPMRPDAATGTHTRTLLVGRNDGDGCAYAVHDTLILSVGIGERKP